MSMKYAVWFLSLATVVLLAGCATPQVPVPLDQNFYQSEKKNVGLLLEVPEKPGLALEGNIGLLDLAIISAATSSLSNHIESQDIAEFLSVKENLRNNLSQEGFTLVEIEAPEKAPKLAKFKDPDSKDAIYYADKDHRGFANSHHVDYLLKLNAKRVGLARPYHAFVPLDAPRAIFEIHGELIDLSDNRLVWYGDIAQSAYTSGEWDEGPDFPGLTNTYYVVMNKAREDIISALAKRDSDIPPIALNVGEEEEETAKQSAFESVEEK